MRAIICADCNQIAQVPTDLDQYDAGWNGRCERCGGRTEVAEVITAAASDQTGIPRLDQLLKQISAGHSAIAESPLDLENASGGEERRPLSAQSGGRIRQFIAQYKVETEEIRHARRVSRQLLSLYQSVRAESPNLAGRTLYRHIVSQHLGLDPQAANTIVWRAEQSFAAWPNERDVQFRDVVLYLAVDEYLKSHVAREGTQINMGNVVTRIIPTDW